MATFARNRTAANRRPTPTSPSTPRALPGLVYLRLAPTQMQVWNGFHEFHGRTVMANGHWLDTPAESTGLPAWIAA